MTRTQTRNKTRTQDNELAQDTVPKIGPEHRTRILSKAQGQPKLDQDKRPVTGAGHMARHRTRIENQPGHWTGTQDQVPKTSFGYRTKSL